MEDVLHATRTAMEENIVAGGGVTLLCTRVLISGLKGMNADRDAGIEIVLHTTEEPLRQIVTNVDDEISVMVSKVIEGKGDYGYNATTGECDDPVEMGVLDPIKVTRTMLQNAASVALLMLTMDCVVAELPKDDTAPAMPSGMGGMGDMDGMM